MLRTSSNNLAFSRVTAICAVNALSRSSWRPVKTPSRLLRTWVTPIHSPAFHLLVADNQVVIGIVENEALGNCGYGVGQPVLRFVGRLLGGDQVLLGAFAVGDVGVNADRVAFGGSAVADLNPAPVG
jgi:hypothetical protein